MNRNAHNERNDIEIQEPTERENKIAQRILDAAFEVHRELGPGLLESTYESCMQDVLVEYGLKVERQKIIPITFRGKVLDDGYRADLLVEENVLIEIKSCEKLLPIHEAQILTYLKLSQVKLGLLLNFNNKLLKHDIKRLILSQNS